MKQIYFRIPTHNRKKFSSTLCHCKAKSALRLNSINTINSTFVEQNFKKLAQNKFKTRQPIQNLTGPLPNSAPKPNYFYSNRLSSHLKLSLSLRCLFVCFLCDRASVYIYIDKRHAPSKLLK